MVGGASAGGQRRARVSANTTADVFAEIANGVQMLLSPAGAFNVDRKAGLVQVTDFPERLDRVALYLDTVHDRVHRQVQIDLRIVEVELNDADAEMLDWAAVAAGAGAEGVAPARRAASSACASPMRTSCSPASPRRDVSPRCAAPRVLALNNEPALVRAAAEAPGRTLRPAAGGRRRHAGSDAADRRQQRHHAEPEPDRHAAGGRQRQTATPRVTTIRETDTLARVADGETLVLGGFTRAARDPRAAERGHAAADGSDGRRSSRGSESSS